MTVRRMSSISVGMFACLSFVAIWYACESISGLRGIMAMRLVCGVVGVAFCLSMASTMRSMPSATPMAGVVCPPKSWMSLS